MGVEPTTLGLLDPRSNQLSYEDVSTSSAAFKIIVTRFCRYEFLKITVARKA